MPEQRVPVLTPANMHAAFDPGGVSVWCDRTQQEAWTNDGFCQFCGSTEHRREPAR